MVRLLLTRGQHLKSTNGKKIEAWSGRKTDGADACVCNCCHRIFIHIPQHCYSLWYQRGDDLISRGSDPLWHNSTNWRPLSAASICFLNKVHSRYKSLKLKSMPAVWKCFETLPKSWPQLQRQKTHAAMERLAADSGLTSATSLAFCKAIFWLAASSSSCSSCGRRRGDGAQKGKQKRETLGEKSRKKKNRRVTRVAPVPWSVPVHWPNCPQRWPRTH